jgi:hypothetical protein
MSTTKPRDTRLDEMHQRIDALEARARAAGTQAKTYMTGRVERLREQEASARTALHNAHEATSPKISERTNAAEDKVQELGTSLKAAEHGLAAELAEDKKAFTDAVEAEVNDFKGFFDGLNKKASTQAGGAKTQLESTLTDLRSSRDKLVERLGEAKAASGERWRERKQSVEAARAEFEKKIDAAMKKFG